MDIQSTLDQLTSLPIPDRIRLVQALWDSIPADEQQGELTPEQREVFGRRLAELDANPGNVLTWEQIKARVKGQP